MTERHVFGESPGGKLDNAPILVQDCPRIDREVLFSGGFAPFLCLGASRL